VLGGAAEGIGEDVAAGATWWGEYGQWVIIAVVVLAIIVFGYSESPAARGMKKRRPLPEVAHDGRFGVPFTR